MKYDSDEYSISIMKVVCQVTDTTCEKKYQATIKELPDVFEYGDTPMEAYNLAIDTIETSQFVFIEEGRLEQFPKPYVYQAMDDIGKFNKEG